MSNFLLILFLLAVLSLIVGLIKPSIFTKLFKKKMTRKNVLTFFGIASLAFFIAFGFTVDTTVTNNQNKTTDQIEQNNIELIQENIVANNEQTSETPEEASQDNNQNQQASDTPLYQVIAVVDGDTVKVDVDGTTKTLRLIGIDTPETVDPRKPVQCFGAEASNRTKQLLLNKKVRLEADPTQGELDKYNRLLRYIYLEDGTFFNKKMISDGYAYEYTYNTPYKYQAEFKQAQTDAKNNKYGLWADGACQNNNQENTQTPPPVNNTESTTYNCSSNTYNCSDFTTHVEAQAVHDYCFSKVGKDIHKLDQNNDGAACESLP